jgi:aminopeptidase N
MNKSLALFVVSCVVTSSFAQSFTHADTLRGSQTPERTWWNALKYDISVSFDPNQQSVSGSNTITYQPVRTGMNTLQIDLMAPLTIDSVISNKIRLEFTRDGNAWFVKAPPDASKKINSITIFYHGIPPVAKNPPWDGGVIWTKDRDQNDWVSVACQGFGASCWYPNKDQDLDEADSAEIHITVPGNLKGISNGRQSKNPTASNNNSTYHWKVTNPINNYNIIPYIGNYESFGETFSGKNGKLDITYWALQEDLKTAQDYWPSRMKESLKSLERWFGPYPFYNDGFKLVQAPHLGMEHQSAIAYGNGFKHGYLGMDLSDTGWGLKWDFIILHETAHEWFGNSITAADVADMWIHEAFATYAEVLYIEEHWGRRAGVDYLVGRRNSIQNDEPVIGTYGVNKGGSGDMYTKGANMIHIMRLIIDNDDKFKTALLEMNKKFFHKQVNTQDILTFWNSYSPRDLTPIFDQYLRTAKPPTLKYKIDKDVIGYQWQDCVPGFNMPVKIDIGKKTMWIYPTTKYQETKSKKEIKGLNREFYVLTTS